MCICYSYEVVFLLLFWANQTKQVNKTTSSLISVSLAYYFHFSDLAGLMPHCTMVKGMGVQGPEALLVTTGALSTAT